MRRTLNLVSAVIFLLAGISALAYLAYAPDWRGWSMAGAALIAVLGGVWLWSTIKEAPDEEA